MNTISLKENHLFSKAYKNGKRAVCRTVSVYVMKDLHARRLKKANPLKTSVNRVGISASKKIGGAVQRNRAKRIVREAYRQIDSLYGIRKGRIIVIAAREKATVVKMQDVMRDLQYALAKLDMLENPPEREKNETESEKKETCDEKLDL